MKKFGLQLRVPPQQQQKKQQPRPPIPTPLAFNDDDDDNVEREILRQAHKNKTHKDVEDQHKKALEEDPLAFDYDGVYDEMKQKKARPVELDRQDRKPRYIQALMDKAKQREREHEISYERKIAKERSKDEHLFADKDKFVTAAYKRKMAEREQWMEEQRRLELREQKDDVTKKSDLTDFYFNLAKNVAFGAGDADSKKPVKQPGEAAQSPGQVPPTATDTSLQSPIPDKRQEDANVQSLSPKRKPDESYAKPISDATPQNQAINELSASDQPKPDHHKRNEDAVAAAKARFLARKKPKV